MKKSVGKRNHIWLRCLSYLLVAAICISLTLVLAGTGKKPETPAARLTSPREDSPLGFRAENGAEKTQDGQPAADDSDKEFMFIDNWYMNTRVKFILDGIWHRMGNTDEILDTVKRIRHTSELSWFREWNRTAERVKAIGDKSLEGGHDISAGDAYLRASNYYLAAEVFLHTNPEDPRILETYRKGADCFIKGLTLLKEPVSVVEIPYEGTTLKGYFFKGAKPGEKAPVLLVHQGFDAPVEATKYIAEEAVKRGYNCLLFEGPGQGLAIRGKKLPFRPDWENVVSPVVDYVLTRDDVDPKNVMLMGISMGGGFATRAAEYEKRLSVCIVNPGYTDLYHMVGDLLGTKLMNLYEQDPKEFNKTFLDMAKYDVGTRWGVNHGMWVFGGKTPAEFLDKLKGYNYAADVGKISCRMLVMDGTKESWGAGQAKKLYDSLTCPKHYMQFTEEDSAAYHCQTGAPAVSTQRMFDWLDENVR